MKNDLKQGIAVIYCRVSSAAQVAKGQGNASQRTRCEEFARMKGYQVTACFEDEAVSGGVIDRPGMLSMLAYLKKHRRDGQHVVLIDDISRLARSIRGHLDLREAIAETGARLESPSVEFGEDSDSILVENLLASVSQHQRQKNTEQTANRMRSRLLNGYWTFSCPPGYRYEARPGEGKVLVRDEPLASIIAQAMEFYASGRFQTQAEVKRYFEGFPEFPKTRHGTVTNENVNRILTRLLYAGYLERPEWAVSLRKARHEPLVSLETYQRIQERLNGKAKVPARADLDESFPLRGFVLCTCGKPLTACWSKSKTGRKHPYYMCFNRACPENRKSIRREVIEGQFTAMLAGMQPSEKMFALAKDMAARVWDQLGEQAAAMREDIRRRMAAIEKQTASLLDRIVEASSQTVIARYEQRITELERERLMMAERLETKARPRKTFGEMFELTLDVIANPCSSWQNGDIGRRHAILKTAFDDRLVYCRNGGFRTPETSRIFSMLGGFCNPKAGLAEGEGFEPSVRLHAQRFSRPSHSTTLAPLRRIAVGRAGDV
ncbi:resolvase [Oceanibaculum indicum P24]|uniref:Resolvase n=1 Tax=Oceanibaculum indicum P24 TaxID=1207063 RepID=K2JTG3_9PROT|nr:resolvase [Oceanibaculum indicum P24]